MKLIFEKSHADAGGSYIPETDVPLTAVPAQYARRRLPVLPELSETEISRHYTLLAQRTYGVNNGFYPLGSCTMKYNPRINEKIAALDGFRNLHPLQPEETIQGALEVLNTAERYFCEITGMDNMTFQPSAGAHGELTGVLLIKAYHQSRGDFARTKVLVPDSAHGTNPATAAMAGYTVITVPSGEDGCVDLDALTRLAGDDTAGIMLTNPNTLGLFDKNIAAITGIVHQAGGLAYYDGANLNAIMGVARPGDMNFDIVHLNLHKTFSTPHGGGGPGSGPVGCKAFLSAFLPGPVIAKDEETYRLATPSSSIGRMKAFHGNFLVVVRALAYVMALGGEGIRNSCEQAVLNANYMKKLLEEK
ncbi:MAG: aminomethyl-transferring glycine dehydrogenase subunit GcvPB, partial [Saccharofermentanales bacterium]